MARLLGPDAGSQLVYIVSGSLLRSAAGYPAVFYTDLAATTLANIATYDGTATPGPVISGSTLNVDSTSRLPRFWFPDGVPNGPDTLYVRVGGSSSPVIPINADYDARIDALVASSGGVTSVNGQSGVVVLDATNTPPASIGAAAAVHTHNGSAITSGTVGISFLPTGTTGTTVAFGNHTHTGVYAPFVALGTANQVLGVNAGASAQEYKTIAGTAGRVTVTHGVGTVTLTLPNALTGPFVFTGAMTEVGDFIITDVVAPGSTKNYRMRTSGSNLDLDFAGSGLFLSGFLNADYTGGQFNYLRLENGANIAHAIGLWGFTGSAFGGFTFQVSGTTGVVSRIESGAAAVQGIATLVAGTVTVNTTAVTANSRIFLTPQNASGTAGAVSVSARVNGTSFTILSTQGADTRAVAWMIQEGL